MSAKANSQAEGGDAAPGAPADAPQERFDPSSWTIGWGRGRKRAVLVGVQLASSAAVAAAAVMTAYLMQHSWPLSMGEVDRSIGNWPGLAVEVLRSPEFASYLPLFVFSPVIHVLVFNWLGLYRPNMGDTRPFRDTPIILKGAILGTGLLIAMWAVYPAAGEAAAAFPQLFFIYLASLIFFGALLCHSASLLGLLALHAAGVGRTRAAILAADDAPMELIEAMENPASEYQLTGLIALRGEHEGALPAPIGRLENLRQIINEHGLDEIILACDPGLLSTKERLDLAQTCWRMSAELKMITPFQPFFRTSAQPEMLGNLPLLHVQNLGLYATMPQFLKRTMDVAISGAALLALSPFMLLIAALIKLDSAGPVFFVQERVGLNGRRFRMFKFRSMKTDADESLHREYLQQLIRDGAAAEAGDGETLYKLTNDPRITRLGHFIRRTSLDELPQLFNVLRGEMSLVGPRPPIQYEVDEYKSWHQRRLHIRPGITGLWQVSGRNLLTFEEMVRLDIAYIERWSLWLDFKILVKTIPVVLKIDQTT